LGALTDDDIIYILGLRSPVTEIGRCGRSGHEVCVSALGRDAEADSPGQPGCQACVFRPTRGGWWRCCEKNETRGNKTMLFAIKDAAKEGMTLIADTLAVVDYGNGGVLIVEVTC
jgi:hypothetical protein